MFFGELRLHSRNIRKRLSEVQLPFLNHVLGEVTILRVFAIVLGLEIKLVALRY
jgi:hypothetical protein